MIMYGDLPPVGHKISLQASTENTLINFLGGHQYWVDSGTSALALAILDAKTHFLAVQKPRVIIPGYCCPDLVAACVYAGVEPVAVDIGIDDPSYDLERLRMHLDEHVVAVIAVNFLGIAERLSELRQLIYSLGLSTKLIEDNAQWFPARQADAATNSDYTVFSFGRGKPLSLFGGGLLRANTSLSDGVIQKIGVAAAYSTANSLKVRAYNVLLQPQFYFLLNRNPLFQLGETKYHALEKIQTMDAWRLSLVSKNFARYVGRVSMLPAYYDDVGIKNGVQQLSIATQVRRKQLLRYPLLCANSRQRDELLVNMRKRGLGATAMYAASIDQIAGMEGLVSVPAPIVNAQQFARRFMTLPLHAGVTRVYREKIVMLLQRAGQLD